MTEDPLWAEPGRARPSPQQAAIVRQVQAGLDALYEQLRGSVQAKLLIEATTCLKNEEFQQACDLVERARDGYLRPPTRSAQTVSSHFTGAESFRNASAAPFERVLASLRTLCKLQPPKAAPASPPPSVPAPRVVPPLAPTLGAGISGKLGEADDPIASTIVTMGSFTHLLNAAQQTGLALTTQWIIDVRDREFPAKRYQRALDLIERVSVQLNSQASQRTAQLRQEEKQYRAGTLRMTPKEWQAKLRRDAEQSTRIERAQRYFHRILEGLRALRAPQGP